MSEECSVLRKIKSNEMAAIFPIQITPKISKFNMAAKLVLNRDLENENLYIKIISLEKKQIFPIKRTLFSLTQKAFDHF